MYKLILALGFMGLVACSNNEANHIAVLKKLDSTLQNTSELAEYGTMKAFKSLNEKLNDYCSADKAKDMLALADSANNLTRKIALSIDKIKFELKKEAGFKDYKQNNYDIESNTEVVKQFFVTKANSKELFSQIKKYKIDLLKVDSNITDEFKTQIQLLPENFNNLIHIVNTKEWDGISVQSALVLLSDLRTRIQLLNNNIIVFIDKKVGGCDNYYDVFSVIVVPSSTTINEGGNMEVYAGVGNFSSTANADIEINHKRIKTSYDGIATYKFKVPLKPGKYLIPVKVKYKNPITGKEETIEKDVEYKVISAN